MTGLEEQVRLLIEALGKVKRQHTVCEDCWYTCPKALNEDGESKCCNDELVRRGRCTCGADAANALIDDAITRAGVL